MKKRLFIHIGSPKTASTSLQYYCRQARDALAERGLYVLSHRDGKVPHRHFLRGVREYQNCNHETLSQIAGEIVNSTGAAALISDENLESEPELANVIHQWAAEHDFSVTFVCLIRTHSDYVNSIFQQNVRAGNCIGFDDFYKRLRKWKRLNYRIHFEDWSHYGDEFIALPFNSAIKKSGVIFEFLRAIGLKTDDLPDASGTYHNVAVSHRKLAFLQNVRLLLEIHGLNGLEAKAFFDIHARVLRATEMTGDRFWGLDAEMVDQIERQFASKNKAFAKKYFNCSWDEVFGETVAELRLRKKTRLSFGEMQEIQDMARLFVAERLEVTA